MENIEISVNKSDIVLWSKPVKIKDLWYNAILKQPAPTKESNIQFIMVFNAEQTSYIVVSKEPLTLEQIDNINLDNFIFDNQRVMSKGVEVICQ